ncbi:magnesium chelatase [Nocardioides sp. Root122]|uniref:magnesium chelatase subunit D family protein n=1 Tax=Nocardioides TaxID=1839 RepID=UPI00070290AC|nr:MULTISPECIES: magnesium chelatase subunit D family protein [Nocardioides]KQV77569.1 magnesium chelatase [Nocardioides sp. Root122]MCK9822005.1 magnesium chelatase subunit D family protein [Nocardioides cavernae]
MPLQYPLSAVVPSKDTGDDMTLALILTTISPEVGGVLVRGEKGTAKSTTVRALASVLPPIEVVAGDRFSSAPGETSPDGAWPRDAETETRPVRLVELPVGATEDRVLGSLHLSKVLADGVAEYEPGLLARAHRGILYVDEVNLLHDHLVDLLLDAAAMGRSTVERDGVSVAHAARFVLVGTMNPEEGELRPQLLDRFGLTVEIAAPRDPQLRAEVVRRRLAFDADPQAFVESYADAERALTNRIAAARTLLPEVELTDAVLTKVAEVCAAFEVDGMRADIVTTRTAIAHAAWHGRTSVTRADIRQAALLALPHRRRRNPFDAPGIDEELLDQVLGDEEPEPEPPMPPKPDDPGGHTDGADGGPDRMTSEDGEGRETERSPEQPDRNTSDGLDGQATGDPGLDTPPRSSSATRPTEVAGVADPYKVRRFEVTGTGAGESGKRSRALTSNGRRVGADPTGNGGLHLVETIRAAAPHQRSRGRTNGRIRFEATDLRTARREGREANLVLFCVDASGSMAARKRMEQVKTAILSLLLDAYQRRDKVGLVTFRADGAEVALPPTHSVDIAAKRLADLPAGGRTPLAEGLLTAAEVLRIEKVRDPRRRPLLIVITDGRATHGPDAVHRSRQAAQWIAEQQTTAVVVDCDSGSFRMGLAGELARHMQAIHLPLADVSARVLTDVARVA